MWLINTGTLELKEFSGENIFPYAILSHRWTDDEISFEDFQNHRRINSHGYEKVVNFCRMARIARIGAHMTWAWADTACIDKRSSAELSEAINSMCQWYKSAHVCFVYLYNVTDAHLPQDVPQSSQDALTQYETLVSRLRSSDWFTRGWTLQELLAPKHVLFFTCTWTPVGSVCEIPPRIYGLDDYPTVLLAEEISEITSIPIHALTGEKSMEDFSIAEKLGWLSRRKTTRTEDMAYCVIGLFGINIPLLYGEGSKAFQRLQEEIIRTSGDESIFAWRGKGRPGLRESILASEAADFDSKHLIYTNTLYPRDPYWITRQILELRLKAHSVLTTVQEQRHMNTIFVPLNCSSTGPDGVASDCVIGLEKRPCGHYDRIVAENHQPEQSQFAQPLQAARRARKRDFLKSIRRSSIELGVRLISKDLTIFVHTSTEQCEAFPTVQPILPPPIPLSTGAVATSKAASTSAAGFAEIHAIGTVFDTSGLDDLDWEYCAALQECTCGSMARFIARFDHLYTVPEEPGYFDVLGEFAQDVQPRSGDFDEASMWCHVGSSIGRAEPSETHDFSNSSDARRYLEQLSTSKINVCPDREDLDARRKRLGECNMSGRR